MTEDLAAIFDGARARLASAPQEALGAVSEPGRLRALLGSGTRIVRRGSAWRLGVLLVSADAVYAVGEVLRAGDPGRRGYAAESARHRAELRAMALRGGFAPGETVHLGFEELDLAAVAAGGASGPLSRGDGRALIRWSAGGAPMPLSAYVDERVALLLEPPAGA